MKNPHFLGAALFLCLALAAPARATLEGDQVNGSATGLTTFTGSPATIAFDFTAEFTGTLDLYGDGSVNVDASFFFSDDYLTIFIEHDLSGSTQFLTDFTVTISDLDYIGFPTYVLTDVSSDFDSLGTGAGLAVVFGDDSIELSFTNLEVPESREFGLALTFEEDDPVTPIPEPTSLTLLSLGAAAIALRRKLA